MREVPGLGVGDWGLAPRHCLAGPRRVTPLNRDLFGDLDSVGVQADDFARMVGEQANGVQAEIGENLRAQAAFVLRLFLAVGRSIGGMIAKTRSSLMQVHQHARSFLGDALHGAANQQMAFAIGGSEDIAIDAMGVHANQHVRLSGNLAVHQSQMALWHDGAGVDHGLEIAEFGVQTAF